MVLFQSDWSRLVLIFVVGLFLCGIFLFISIKLLTRNRNRLTLTLSAFYLFSAAGFLINAIYSVLRINPIVYVLLFITYFLVVFSQIFLVSFLLNLVNVYVNWKKQIAIILSFGILLFLVLSIPGGMTINEETNWRPIYSWPLTFGIIILVSTCIVIPTIILSIKMYKIFEDKNLKRKLQYFLVGIFGIFVISYGAFLNFALKDPEFNAIWTYIALLVIPFGIMIYYGIGHSI